MEHKVGPRASLDFFFLATRKLLSLPGFEPRTVQRTRHSDYGSAALCSLVAPRVRSTYHPDCEHVKERAPKANWLCDAPTV